MFEFSLTGSREIEVLQKDLNTLAEKFEGVESQLRNVAGQLQQFEVKTDKADEQLLSTAMTLQNSYHQLQSATSRRLGEVETRIHKDILKRVHRLEKDSARFSEMLPAISAEAESLREAANLQVENTLSSVGSSELQEMDGRLSAFNERLSTLSVAVEDSSSLRLLEQRVRDLEGRAGKQAKSGEPDTPTEVERWAKQAENGEPGLDSNFMIELNAWKANVTSQIHSLEVKRSADTFAPQIKVMMAERPAMISEHQMSASDSPRAIDDEEALKYLMKAHDEIGEEFYQFQHSVYDCSLLAFSELLYLEDSFAILFGEFTCITMQMTILLLVYEYMIIDPFSWQESAWRWRLEHAHYQQNMNDVHNISLARAFCTKDGAEPVLSGQFLLLRNIEDYTQTFLGFDIYCPQGIPMIMMILLLWICDCTQEIRNCVKMTVAVSSLPHPVGSSRTHFVVNTTTGKFEISEISSMRIAAALCVCLFRLIVGFFLCMIGCRWLVQTIDLEELLLNTVALTFIVGIDETMLRFMASTEVRWVIENMESLPAPGCFANRGRWNHFILPSFGILLGTFMWVYFMAAYVMPYLDNLHAVHEISCGGFKDFVAWRKATSGLVQIEATDGHSMLDQGLIDSIRQNIGVTPGDIGKSGYAF